MTKTKEIDAATIQSLTSNGSKLPLMEHFNTIQGEGFFQGHAAYFIRLGGCDVGCVWCDVKESWEINAHPIVDVDKIGQLPLGHKGNIVVVTGGEPALFNLSPLTQAFQKNNLKCHIETSGAYELTGQWDWICVSPKKFKKPIKTVVEKANELKVIVYNHSDFEWGEQYAQLTNKNCKLFLQPEWSVAQKLMPLIIDYVKENPKWQISLQTHKYMNIP